MLLLRQYSTDRFEMVMPGTNTLHHLKKHTSPALMQVIKFARQPGGQLLEWGSLYQPSDGGKIDRRGQVWTHGALQRCRTDIEKENRSTFWPRPRKKLPLDFLRFPGSDDLLPPRKRLRGPQKKED
jgi:hypothetical protein